MNISVENNQFPKNQSKYIKNLLKNISIQIYHILLYNEIDPIKQSGISVLGIIIYLYYYSYYEDTSWLSNINHLPLLLIALMK